jgi:hypothetical protein
MAAADAVLGAQASDDARAASATGSPDAGAARAGARPPATTPGTRPLAAEPRAEPGADTARSDPPEHLKLPASEPAVNAATRIALSLRCPPPAPAALSGVVVRAQQSRREPSEGLTRALVGVGAVSSDGSHPTFTVALVAPLALPEVRSSPNASGAAKRIVFRDVASGSFM